MSGLKEGLPLDAKLLSQAIIELNISRHNVSIYPRSHPIVQRSLDRAFECMQKLLDLRDQVTLAVAKDILIVDEFSLDKDHPVFRDFASSLNKMYLASITFISGLTRDELYSFHSFLLSDVRYESPADMQARLQACQLSHIRAEFIDYAAFTLSGNETVQEQSPVSLWEKYIFGLLEGRLQAEDVAEIMPKIPHEKLAGLMNRISADKIRENSYERIITSYLKQSSERSFTGRDLKRLYDFIDNLRPELKRQFLSSAAAHLTSSPDTLEQSLREMSPEDIMMLLRIMNEQMVIIPEALKNVLDKFAEKSYNNSDITRCGTDLIEDDILLSPEISNLMHSINFKSFVSDEYQNEIQRLLRYDSKRVNTEWIGEHENELRDEYLDMTFHLTVLELISSDDPDLIPEEDRDAVASLIKDMSMQLVETGRYREVLDTCSILKGNLGKGHLRSMIEGILEYFKSVEFLVPLVRSLRICGRQSREEAIDLCNQCGENIVPLLMDALIKEESQSIRRFLISLISHLGDSAIPQVIERLKDTRWYVIRNMLFILLENGNTEALRKARPFCRHENPKVSIEAIKCLLAAQDPEGVTALRSALASDKNEIFAKAVQIAGTYKVKDTLPDLLRIIRKKSMNGTDIEAKIPVARSIGQMGAPEGLECLNGILSERSFLFRGSLEKLKREIRTILKSRKEVFVH